MIEVIRRIHRKMKQSEPFDRALIYGVGAVVFLALAVAIVTYMRSDEHVDQVLRWQKEHPWLLR